ncbi:MAG: hypothetical protein CO094_06755 [Anaerolineae bacterium CG_4_9_14_3_um_filter_57_17]|nr:hypothetical protein [bacterium]NCT21761.1 hypothetical protein [bacterium]OIO86410.1 MAG: hypothetical protein AUK01_03200 [Anaerolineae bacterium CG2_30_57_67]PJB66563.1 MAG: hypothetical protein CO094_06755 [Anaerolineae bacterium CG_4_9_14_3_um_filter_57_17]
MKNRGQLALGLILILLGAFYLAQMQYPQLKNLLGPFLTYPLNVVAAGGAVLVIGLLTGASGLAVPAAIVAGIGGILYYQEAYHDPMTWAYMWTLIPGFAGVGAILEGLLTRNTARARGGLDSIVTSAILFVIFAAIFGKLTLFGPYGPAILLILAGLWLAGRAFWRR